MLKFLLKLDPRTPTDKLYKDLKILKVKDIFEVNILSFVKKCLLEECPDIFYNYFKYQQHGHDIRDRKLYVPRWRIKLAYNSVKIKGPTLWNALDKRLKSKAYLKSFKRIIKQHYIGKY